VCHCRRLGRYPDAELVWCQEEPKNMGYWAFVQPRVNTAVREILEVGDAYTAVDAGNNGNNGNYTLIGSRDDSRRVRYVGRPAAASPATGSPVIHAAETKALVHEALGLDDKGIHLAEPRSNIPRY